MLLKIWNIFVKKYNLKILFYCFFIIFLLLEPVALSNSNIDIQNETKNQTCIPDKRLISELNTNKKKDVIGIGQAVIDTVYKVDSKNDLKNIVKTLDADIVKNSKTHNHNRLFVNSDKNFKIPKQAKRVYSASGGVAANTMVYISVLGGEVAFIAAEGDDKYANTFNNQMTKYGVNCIASKEKDSSTCRVDIFVSNDGDRTMISKGGANKIDDKYFDWDVISQYRVILIEGYILSDSKMTDNLVKLAEKAHKEGIMVALTMIDENGIDERRKYYDRLIGHIDYLFGSKSGMEKYFNTNNIQDITKKALKKVKVFVATQGKKGAVIGIRANQDDICKSMNIKEFTCPNKGDEIISISSIPTTNVVDTTGAGDAFAAGFLYAQLRGYGPTESAHFATEYAVYTIKRLGTKRFDNLNQEVCYK